MFKWLYYHIRTRIGWRCNKYFGHYFHNNYEHRKILSLEEGNLAIKKMVESGEPFVAARFGKTELDIMVNHEWEHKHLKKASSKTDYRLYELSGFFPNEREKYKKFYEMMVQSISQVDILGVWFTVMEEYMVNEYMPKTTVVPLMSIEPFYFDNPWSQLLKGKKVLLIHPFAETIEMQYKKRTEIFDNKLILPKFELKTIKAIQTIADQKDDRFSDWFEALEYMKSQMKAVDFDITIIGCGAYGMPLALEAKKMGKQAIHMGGGTQIMFGIKGKRWDDDELVHSMYNDSWVRPLDADKPKGAEKVEGSCYW